MATSPRTVTFEVTVRPKGKRTRESVIGEVVLPVTYVDGKSEVSEADLSAALVALGSAGSRRERRAARREAKRRERVEVAP